MIYIFHTKQTEKDTETIFIYKRILTLSYIKSPKCF